MNIGELELSGFQKYHPASLQFTKISFESC